MNQFSKTHVAIFILLASFIFVAQVSALELNQIEIPAGVENGCGLPGGTVILFNDPSDPQTNLLSHLPERRNRHLIDIKVNIPPGEYDVSLISFDHHTTPDDPISIPQTHEQWHLIFMAGETVVATSDRIRDLPAEDFFVTQTVNESLFISQQVDSIRAIHSYHLDPQFGQDFNSVYPICAGLNRIEPLASIGDIVWLDENKDGVQDEGEDGVADVTVHLLDGDGKRVTSMKTNANGRYLFDNLKPGKYSVTVEPPEGFVVTSQNAGAVDVDSDIDTNGRMVFTTLDPDEHDMTWDAGIFRQVQPTHQVFSFVFCDTNENGLQDGDESGLADIEMGLVSGETEIETLRSDSEGKITFTERNETPNLVRLDPPEGYFVTGQHARSSINTEGSTAATFTFGLSGLCAPVTIVELAAIGDFVWLDNDQNDVQDSGEPGVSGVLVVLYDGDENEVARTATDENGRYRFDDLVPGDYSLRFSPPAEYEVVARNRGEDGAIDSDIENGRTVLTTLEPGETDLTWDAGLFRQSPPPEICETNNGFLIFIIIVLLVALFLMGIWIWQSRHQKGNLGGGINYTVAEEREPSY